ncbi:hypothetical protein EJ05DRAFT_508180 [Pseudovirgaria hyperparasitica]|uniref:Uncharacterized protein n=1 Tax=Pseudovirgaria hyperparasitica TaxID=470096 RepID=A0A6A6WFY8_9PEZI|nr:uncharacterized protein EJ05DRAFT_508180 [Pseudovirgaria hyperparasitica]KAF2760950.1 hypothetical protein EJ05DRAFT_508180 [Pseudovirgaria hyperparasitica]
MAGGRLATVHHQVSSVLLRPHIQPSLSVPTPSPLRNTTTAIQSSRQTQSCFSTSAPRPARKGAVQQVDPRVTNIRYHLFHPRVPRPLRFSRLRALRHWTIHRAWQMFKAKTNTQREKELERQYQSMARACEELRLTDENGMRVSEADANGNKKVGRLFRIAMEKKRVWGPGKGFPIEYARAQTDYPPRNGWNHEWTR